MENLENKLALHLLPELPQCKRLSEAARALWEQESVRAVWLGGSLARGGADLYSDIDLRIAVAPDALDAWHTPDLNALFQNGVLAYHRFPIGEMLLHHLLLDDGDIYDLVIQSVEQPPTPEAVLILGCRNDRLREQLQHLEPPAPAEDPPATKESVLKILNEFWINEQKHRKVLHRNLYLVVLTGISMQKTVLLRLWYILETGCDYALQGQSIHALARTTRLVEEARGERVLQVLGASAMSRREVRSSIELIRREVALAGRELARKMDFEYPEALEQRVLQDWEAFLSLA